MSGGVGLLRFGTATSATPATAASVAAAAIGRRTGIDSTR